MKKDFAIEIAINKAKIDSHRYFVVHEPSSYNQIFENSGFKVLANVSENNLASVVFETD